ncbi:MAG: ribosomal L7Ae/L30e/S12e/Gadd45 family protein [Clostridia bacterium]|nr:ribosomal L7Ae/L30e/S12e/Gadd45 family protein [Clostridia bacterium]
MLGLSRRAGAVCPGVSALLGIIKSRKKPCLVLVAVEASKQTKSKLYGVCHTHAVPYYTVLSQGMFGEAIGARTEILALGITNQGLAERILTCITPQNPVDGEAQE